MATGGQPNDYKCDKERTNYARLCRAIIDLCTQVLRDVLARQILPKDIVLKASRCPTLKLNPSQHGVLSSASSINSYEKFDITLLCAAIRCLCPSIKPTIGWGSQQLPSPSDKTEGDDVECKRIIRNKIYGHVSSTRVNDSVFQQYWQVLRDVMIHMDNSFGAQSSYSQILTFIENDNMDEANERMFIEKIKEMAEKEKEIWREIQQIKQETAEDRYIRQSIEKKVTDIDSELNKQKQQIRNLASETTDNQQCFQRKVTDMGLELNKQQQQIDDLARETSGKKSLRSKSAAEKYTLDEINRHKESKIFVATKAFREGKSKLDEHGVLIYTGLSGDGKTETSIAIMESYQQDHPDWCFIMYSDIHHWPKVHTDVDSVILYDDCLGRTNTNTGVINEGNDIWPRILSSVKAGKIKVIFTVRKNIISTNQIELEKYELFHKNHVIDLTADEYKLTKDDKIEIFKAHCQRNNINICEHWIYENYRQANEVKKDIPITISNKTMLEIVNTNSAIGFPFACYLYTCHMKYIRQGVSFFKKPIQVLHNEISRLMKIESKPIEKLQYCIMVYMVLKQGHINLDEIDDNILRQVFKSVGEECLSQRYIKEAVQELNHKYLVGYYPMFSFKHQTLLESVSICFWEDNISLVLRYCSEEFIMEFIRLEDYKQAEGEVVVKLKERDYKHLIERFIEFFRYEVGLGWHWISHPVMRNKDFVCLFTDVLKSDKTVLSTKSSELSVLINSACELGNIYLLNGLYSIDDQIQDTLTTLFNDYCYKYACLKGHTDIVVWLLDNGIRLDIAFKAIQHTSESKQLATIINHPNIKLDHLKEALRFSGFRSRLCKSFNNVVISLVFNKWPDIDLESVSILFISHCAYDEMEFIQSIKIRPDLITPQAVNEGFRYACSCGNLKVVKVLVNQYLDLNHAQEILNEGFSLSCAMGKTEILDFLIEITNSTSKTASKLQLNTGKGFIFATPLSKQFYDLPYELKQNKEELTNLHISAFFGRHIVFKQLINLGLDITSKTGSGVTVLQFAMAGFISCRRGIDPEHISFINNRESMFLSTYYKYCRQFEGKLTHFLDIYMSYRHWHEETLIYLIKHENCISSDLDITLDSSGNTIAHYCVFYNCLSVIELLCKVRPSLMIVCNKNNHKPIDLAVLMGRDEIFKLLYSNDTRFNCNTKQTRQEYDELHTLFSIWIKYTNSSYIDDYPDFLRFLPQDNFFIEIGKRKNYKEIEQIINGQLQ